MLGYAKIANENEESTLRGSGKNDIKHIATPRRAFALINNQAVTPSTLKKPGTHLSLKRATLVFEDDPVDLVGSAEEANSFEKLCEDTQKKNEPLSPWEEYPEVDGFTTAPPPSPFCDKQNDFDSTVNLVPDEGHFDLSSSFDELCAKLYEAPKPWPADEVPPVEFFPPIPESSDGFEADFLEDSGVTLESDVDDVPYSFELNPDYIDSDQEIDEASYYLMLAEAAAISLEI